MMRLILVLMAAASFLPPEPVWAEGVIATLSNRRVEIRSNFVGTELVVFGSIERDAATVGRARGYDVVVVVRGPTDDMVSWRKERIAGIWVNATGVEFVRAPSYYAVLSNRPLSEISGPLLLRRRGIGLDHVKLVPRTAQPPEVEAEFRDALIRRKMEQHLYIEDGRAVQMLTQRLFQVPIPLPTRIRTGGYTAVVHVFADGALLASTEIGFWVFKHGFEAAVFDLAHRQPLLYGLATVAMAFGVGWLGSVLFRRD
ncbi:uncharacterized protein (TIGR02186 family) [Tepidamorphus gemmatus]|uniref:Uncharacterized protein (TIGR02186 family) n=1 Tax=Tepidamorphus gemmatus TaxID=747076 RepID=A0A4R3MC80_9HYPH|nr:TIGR02186 family protein [Tepidamorphus gemmatus]TCT09859.1 uncharacterized protein (TIGR02186 family) [Tepidamorphus gemmatus]